MVINDVPPFMYIFAYCLITMFFVIGFLFAVITMVIEEIRDRIKKQRGERKDVN